LMGLCSALLLCVLDEHPHLLRIFPWMTNMVCFPFRAFPVVSRSVQL
jgi:hypothetical protein